MVQLRHQEPCWDQMHWMTHISSAPLQLVHITSVNKAQNQPAANDVTAEGTCDTLAKPAVTYMKIQVALSQGAP